MMNFGSFGAFTSIKQCTGSTKYGLAAAQLRLAGMTVVAAFIFCAPLQSEPTTVGAEPTVSSKLELVVDETLGGVAVRVEGEAGPDTVAYYYVEGLDIMSPVSVRVLAVDPAKPVKLTLHRAFWDRPEVTAQTDQRGAFALDSRVDGDLGIGLSADETSGFYLLIWSDAPVEAPMPNVLYLDSKLVDLNAKDTR